MFSHSSTSLPTLQPPPPLLPQLTSIVGRSPRITADLGDLAPALIARFSDSNAKLVMATCSIFGSIATAMGPNVKKYCHTFLPPIYGVLADAKV